MNVPRFDLDHWMHEYQGDPPRYDLSGSTGPVWTIGAVLELAGLEADEVAAQPAVYSTVDGLEELRAAVGEMEGVSADDVQITTGASEALTILTAAHAGDGGNVVLPDPGYPPFGALAEIFGLEVRRYELSSARDFRVDPEALGALVDDSTAVIIVNSPHNPTGASVTREELARVRAAADRAGATLVLDRVFHPISHGPDPLFEAAADGTVLVGDLSKALSLAGPRIGWIVDTDAKRRASYFDLRAYFTLSSPPLAERLATIAVTHRDAILTRAQTTATRNLSRLSRFMSTHQERLGWVKPTGGLVTFPWLKQVENARPFCRQLADAGVLLAPGDCFGHPRHFRLGFGSNDPETFDAALSEFEAFLVGGG